MLGDVAVIKELEGKGLGIVATRTIPRGQRILSEAPFLVIYHSEIFPWEKQLDEFRNGGIVPSAFERQVLAKLLDSPETHQAFWALCDSHSRNERTACGVMLSNSLSMGPRLQDSGMLALGSRFNHSCSPNVSYSWQEELGRYFFHTACDVQEGDELTISYVSPFRPRSIRQDTLAVQFKFKCCCACCSLDPCAIKASDERRCKMFILEKKLASLLEVSPSEKQVTNALSAVSELVSLIEEELQGNPKYKARAYYSGMQITLAAECPEEAMQLVEKMQEQAILTVGEDGDVGVCLGIVSADSDEEEDRPRETGYKDKSEVEEDAKHAQSRSYPIADDTRCLVNTPASDRAAELKRCYKGSSAAGRSLDMQGLHNLLKQGRPDIEDKDVLALFGLMKKDSDGKIEFDELVDFLYTTAK